MTYHNDDNINSIFFFNEPLLTSQNLFENYINDHFLNEEDYRGNYFYNENIYQDFNIKPFMNSKYNFDNITSDITDKIPKKLPEIDNGPPFYSLNAIRGILIQNDEDNKRLFDNIIQDQRVLESEEYMKSGKKKSISDIIYQNDNIFNQENSLNFEYEEVKEKDNYLTKKRGRKTDKNVGEEHNRYHADNIIKKIKAKLFDYCLNFINKMIYKNNEEGMQLLKIDYKYTDKLERKMNLELFEMPLIDIFSLDISRKYKSKSKDYNKILINGILEQKIEVEDYDTIMFLFNITLNDWIDLFTYKKNILTFINDQNAINVNKTKIQENFIGINHLLNEISEKKDFKNDDKYYTLFLLYIFNFQRWFHIKKGRVLKKKGE
jgi:hypothetical protein